MAGYTRQDISNEIDTGQIIKAAPLDAEFNAIVSAFSSTTGHKHSGLTGEGAPITVVGPAQDIVVTVSSVTPKTDNTMDLGSTTYEFKDLWIDGTANIDLLTADAGTVGGAAITTISNTQTLTGKTVDLTNNTLVATSAQLAAAVTDETGTGALVFAGSPALTGVPTAPTAVADTNTTQLATTAHVFAERANPVTLTNKTVNLNDNTLVMSSLQLLNSVTDATGTGQLVFATGPALAGVPTAPTAVVNTDTAQIATTAFVQDQVEAERSATTTLTNKTINLGSNTLQTTSTQLRTAISDSTGSGNAVFATSPSLTSPSIAGGSINLSSTISDSSLNTVTVAHATITGATTLQTTTSGSALSPVIRFDPDTNTGIYQGAAGSVAISADGQKSFEVTQTEVRPGVTNTSDLGSSSLKWKDLYVDGIGYVDQINSNALEVTGNINLNAATTETRQLQIGQGRTGSGFAYIDLVGDATYTDYGLRVIRNNTGANTDSSILHRGSGDLILNSRDTGDLLLQTADLTRVTIANAGDVTIDRNLAVGESISALNLVSGTYTPTLTNVLNVASSTASVAQYFRFDNTVTVSGQVVIDPTAAATDTELGISLPIASLFASQVNCGGTLSIVSAGSYGEGGAINADVANDRAQALLRPTNTASRTYAFHFTYRIL